MGSHRTINHIVKGASSTDGDGVQLKRLLGGVELNMLDPFLLLDAFGSEKPDDYIGGFPSHPHRGFETVSYMLEGKMRHKDSAGNEGVISAGGVQWMTAASGIIHSEMPVQEFGRLAGFQLWVNLPAVEKMSRPKYQEYDAESIAIEEREFSTMKVIAGTTKNNTKGVIDNQTVSPVYWDVQIVQNGTFEENLTPGHNAFIYVISGSIFMEQDDQNQLSSGELGVLSDGENISINAHQQSRMLIIAGKPLNEPVFRAGPFVMNTKEELQQAFTDYRDGKLVQS